MIADSGTSWATPPGRMYAWFIRRPEVSSKMSRMYSRSRKPYSIIEIAPSSMPVVPSQTRCDEIRLSSMKSTRIVFARSVIWSVMPSSFSTARQ